MKIARSGRLLLGTVTALALMLTSVHMANATTAQSLIATAYSGEELFEGLLLNNGSLAEDHPEALLDPNLAGVVSDDMVDAIMMLVAEHHPEAFDDFAAAVTSNDPYVVRQGLYDGRDVLEDVLASASGSPGAISPMADTICSLTACAVSFVAVAIFVVVAAVIRPRSNSAFANAETSSHSLELDEWVARIIQEVG